MKALGRIKVKVEESSRRGIQKGIGTNHFKSCRTL